MGTGETLPVWTWAELERELLTFTPGMHRIMTRHLLEVTRQGAGEMTRQELLRELLMVIWAAEGPCFSARSPSTGAQLAI